MNADRDDTQMDTGTNNSAEQSMLDSVLVAIRTVASVGAVCVIAFGVVLAIQLFTFFRAIIDEPATVIASWQQAMDAGRPAREAAALPDAPENVPVEVESPAIAPTSAEVPAGELESNNETAEAVPVTPASGQPANPKPRANEDTPPFVILADRVMDRLEVGEFSWLIGVGVLVIFCWLLIKIPAMLITAGTRLLLGLVNVSTDP